MSSTTETKELKGTPGAHAANEPEAPGPEGGHAAVEGATASQPAPKHDEPGDEAATDTKVSCRTRVLTDKAKEEMVRGLKYKQRAALGNVTKKRNEISKSMTDTSNLHLVKTALEEFNEQFLKYQELSQLFFENMDDDDDASAETERYEAKELSVLNFRTSVEDWVHAAERRLTEDLDNTSRRTSRHSSARSSRSSTRSTTSERLKAKARLAELVAERSLAEKQMALESQRNALQLDMEIAKARAREQVFAEEEEEPVCRPKACGNRDPVVSDFEADKLYKLPDQVNGGMSNNTPFDLNVKSGNHAVSTNVNTVSSDSMCKSKPSPDQTNMVNGKSVQQNVISNHGNNNTHSSAVKGGSVETVTRTQNNGGYPNTNESMVTQSYVSHNDVNLPSYHGNQNQNVNMLCQTVTAPPSGHIAGTLSDVIGHGERRPQLRPEADQFQPRDYGLGNHPSPNIQRQINDIASYISLPSLEVPKFHGDVTQFNSFMLAFNSRIASRAASDADRLYYLHQHLKGEPQDLIDGCLHLAPEMGYQEARQLLYREYGDVHKISTSYLNMIFGWKPIHHDDPTALKKFSLLLVKCFNAMQNVANMQVLNHSPNLQTIISKLPAYLQNKWRDFIFKIRTHESRTPSYADVVKFVHSAAEVANDPVFSREALHKSDGKTGKGGASKNGTNQTNKPKATSFAVNLKNTNSNKDAQSSRNNKPKGERKCYYCDGNHIIDSCESFLKLTVEQKRDFLKEKRRCFGCFGLDHRSKGCMNKRTCRTCGKGHPTCLHIDGFQLKNYQGSENRDQPQSTETTEDTPAGGSVSTLATTSGENTVLQAVIPVQVRQRGQTRSVRTYAFYDQGSTGCFASEELCEELCIAGSEAMLQMKTMHGTSYVNTSVMTGLIVSDLQGDNEVELPKTYTRAEIPVTHDQIPKPQMLQQWPHLQEVARQMPEYNDSWRVGLLIGNNCPSALEPIKVIPVTDDSPLAVQYRHGWTINGPLQVELGADKDIISCNRVTLQEIESSKEVLSPEKIISILESDFANSRAATPRERGPSQEDIMFLKKANENIQLVDGHYTLPLPFRDPEISLPNNRGQAIKRALGQKHKMLRNPAYRRDYVKFMDNILDKGYAAPVPEAQLDGERGKLWYVPHHGVYNPRKPEKIRVVFDCSCKFNGISLNDCLLAGPDLTNSLIGVLTRFREHEVAIGGDIESMFYQVRIPDSQYDYLRFLWWPNGDLEQEFHEYYMKVHLFGAISSPSIANFALRQIVKDLEVDQAINQAIVSNFYVDDCLCSTPNPETARSMMEGLTSACSQRGFRLTKWCSPNKEVLQAVPPEERSKECKDRDLEDDSLPMERALGLQWSLENDSFGFTISLPEKPMTRRGLLSMACTIFDPLGFVAPFILPAKRILQELCKEKIDWDEEIPDPYRSKFLEWIEEVPLLKDVSLKRCFKPTEFGLVENCQLHVFADASSYGYGTVAYLRLTSKEKIHTSFLLGKARLAPLKATTIPRLELTAATVAVHVGQMLLKEVHMKVDSVTYHTDSTTVIYYLSSQTKRFPVFVANRVQQILEFSTPDQWKYVNTSINPADIASRGVQGKKFEELNQWLEGPEFLKTPESEWPKQPDLFKGPDMTDVEAMATSITPDSEQDPVTRLATHFSSWTRLRKAVAVFLTLKSILRDRSKGDASQRSTYFPFTVEQMESAEYAILRDVQKKNFKETLDSLTQKKQGTDQHRGRAKHRLPLQQLDPILIDDLLRVGGRISRAEIPEYAKHQILLPAKHPVTNLIIRHAHEQLAHAGRNHVMAKLRERYWITAMNSAVRRVIYTCVWCRRQKRPCVEQKMADLPQCRMEPAPPFTYTGLDLFGPFMIKERRKEIKRYGIIFTCMSSRAIHLEPATSLETDSFLNALQRFISRRGPVKEIACDNGTNFVGASNELKNAMKGLQQDKIQSRMLHYDITWKFNPPAASHMGGAWERQIRSVRRVMTSLVHDHGTRLDDECFHTLLCEVESIINSRPLTGISEDVDDYQPLTPSQLLTLKPTMVSPPGHFEKEDVYARKRWRRVQYLSQLFWTRWKREYLVELQRRQKWLYPQRNMKSGDIVLIKDEHTPRHRWSMAKISETEKDKSGTVRSVQLKTKTTELRRPVQKLVLLLPVEEQ